MKIIKISSDLKEALSKVDVRHVKVYNNGQLLTMDGSFFDVKEKGDYCFSGSCGDLLLRGNVSESSIINMELPNGERHVCECVWRTKKICGPLLVSSKGIDD